jgi:adenylate cyclase
MTGRRSRRRLALLGLVAVAAPVIALVAYATGVLEKLELTTVDARFSVRGAEHPPRRIVVVGVDENSLADLPNPVPRRDDAAVIARLAQAGARVIGIDFEFSGSDAGRLRYCPAFQGDAPVNDCALVTATIQAHDVVFAATAVDAHGRTNVLGGTDLRYLNATAGHAAVPTDADGAVRRVWYEWQAIPSFAVAVAEQFLHRRVGSSGFDQTIDGAPAAWIDFRGPAGTVPLIPYIDVLRGRFDPALVRGRIVIVGDVTASLKDVFTTSVGGDALMPGPELQAEAIDTVLRGLPLQNASGLVAVVLILALGVVVPAASIRIPLIPTLAIALAATVAFLVAAQLAFDGGTVIVVTYPLLALALAVVGGLAVHYVTETRERRRVHALFARFVPEDVVDEVLARADDDLRLGGVKRDGTVMFCDVRGFTTFAESLPVERVMTVLNGYLTEMTDAVLNHGGTLVAYMGDGIMAVFGAPLPQPDHADRALAAAREMLGPRLRAVNESMRGTSLGWAFEIGIGLNSGHVLSGHVGSARRMEYTAIGDTTNTAARLEAMTKGSPHQILIAESTRSRLAAPPPDLVFVGESAVRGRQEPIRLWTLAEAAGPQDGGGTGAAAVSGAPRTVAAE